MATFKQYPNKKFLPLNKIKEAKKAIKEGKLVLYAYALPTGLYYVVEADNPLTLSELPKTKEISGYARKAVLRFFVESSNEMNNGSD